MVRPSLAARGSIPWYGDGPALVRPAAVRDATDASSTVAMGLHAASIGYRTTVIPRTLARVRGPNTLGESLAFRRAVTLPLRRLARGRLAGVSRNTRIAHRLGLIAPIGYSFTELEPSYPGSRSLVVHLLCRPE